jgi:hypothetical protein
MASSYINMHPVDEILSSILVEAVPSDDQLIADKIFETIKVPERSGTLLLETSRNFMGAGAGLDLRTAPGSSRPLIGGFDRSSQTFMIDKYSAEDFIAMEDIADSQYPGSEEARAAKKVARVMKLNKEKRAADLLFGTANFGNDTAANEFGGEFDDANAEPLSDLYDLKNTIFEGAHGINPDTLILGHKVFLTLAKNPEVRGFAGTSSAGFASGSRILSNEAVMQVLRDVLGIPNIYVGSARQDTSVPGATSSEGFIWTQDSLFMGILKGSDAIVQKSGTVKGMPVAALNLVYQDMLAAQYDTPDRLRRHVYGEEFNKFHAVDSNLGRIITSVVN